MTFQQLLCQLRQSLDPGEAKAAALWLLEAGFGLKQTDVLMGGVEALSPSDEQRLVRLADDVAGGTPVQYAVGKAFFADLTLEVGPGVLIPRPETAELCRMIADAFSCNEATPRILDLCTGSGCIALYLKKHIPNAAVAAADFFPLPLATAAANSRLLSLPIEIRRMDALRLEEEEDVWDVIVANPPYVMDEERAGMQPSVLCHEPHEALFPPSSDPLAFYRSISRYAGKALRKGGRLFFEINALLSEETAAVAAEEGFADIRIADDQFGLPRFLTAERPSSA